jgi:hypothetical protein
MNCFVDHDDYWRFHNCLTRGRRRAPAPQEACLATFDHDGDGDLDLRDFAAFQAAFTRQPW